MSRVNNVFETVLHYQEIFSFAQSDAFSNIKNGINSPTNFNRSGSIKASKNSTLMELSFKM